MLTDQTTDRLGSRTDVDTPAASESAPFAAFPDPLLSVLLVATYVALEWLSFMHQHDGLPVTPWNPGHGMMLAAIILGGTSYGFVFLVGVLLAEVVVLNTTLPIPIVIAIAAAIAGTYTVVATAARPYLRHDPDVFLTRDTLVLFVAGATGAVVVAVILCGLLLSIDRFDLSDIARTATPLVLGDLIGIMVVTPLLLRGYQIRSRLLPLPRGRIAEFSAFVLAVLSLLLVTTWPGIHQQNLFYLLFLPIGVAAVRHGIDGACAALGLVQLILVALLHFHGFDLSRFTEYQMLMLVLTLTGLVVGALVSERRRADERARRAAERLQEIRAEAARAARLNVVSGMAAALAHEVNQPMTAARAHARSVKELLRAPRPDDARVLSNVTAMIEQIDHAAAVVSRMREFLRRGEPHISSIDLPMLLSEAVALAKPLASERQIGLHLAVVGTLPPMWGDRIQIQQVIINLVRNAIEAIGESGRTDGRVDVTARPSSQGREIEIIVADNGAGIEASRIDTLFDPLSTSRPDGIGLGLSICKSIVQAHSGRIWLAATVPSRTEFRFTLPSGSGKACEGNGRS